MSADNRPSVDHEQPGSLDCAECGTALNDSELLLDRKLCDWCHAEDVRRYGPEDDETRTHEQRAQSGLSGWRGVSHGPGGPRMGR